LETLNWGRPGERKGKTSPEYRKKTHNSLKFPSFGNIQKTNLQIRQFHVFQDCRQVETFQRERERERERDASSTAANWILTNVSARDLHFICHQPTHPYNLSRQETTHTRDTSQVQRKKKFNYHNQLSNNNNKII
jgi:hypothetical protein